MNRWVLLSVVAGMALPIQGALNGRIRTLLSNPVQAALINFVVGTVAILLFLVVSRAGVPNVESLRKVPVITLVGGGLIGASFVALIAALIPRLGAGSVFALVIGGQLLVSALLDHYGLLGVEVRPLGLQRGVGLALLLTGAALVTKG